MHLTGLAPCTVSRALLSVLPSHTPCSGVHQSSDGGATLCYPPTSTCHPLQPAGIILYLFPIAVRWNTLRYFLMGLQCDRLREKSESRGEHGPGVNVTT
jgi:hypothetical protein